MTQGISRRNFLSGAALAAGAAAVAGLSGCSPKTMAETGPGGGAGCPGGAGEAVAARNTMSQIGAAEKGS